MRRRHDVVLSIHPNVRGIAYAAFEGPLSPIGWGNKRILGANKNVVALETAKRLIEQFQPDILVLEDCAKARSRKSDRIRRLHRLLKNAADGEAIETKIFSREDIRACFNAIGARTRFEIASAIGARVHAFGNMMPRPKKEIWMPEDNRLKVFDAASLVMTYYCQAKSIDKVAPAPQS